MILLQSAELAKWHWIQLGVIYIWLWLALIAIGLAHFDKRN